MFVAKSLLFALILLPLLEIGAFVLVAGQIGAGPAFLLLLATVAAGVLVLRRAGRAHLAQFRASAGQRGVFAVTSDGPFALFILGGILLVIPGFLTDLLALFVLAFGMRAALRRDRNTDVGPDGVVDLAPDEWRPVPEERISPPRDGDSGR